YYGVVDRTLILSVTYDHVVDAHQTEQLRTSDVSEAFKVEDQAGFRHGHVFVVGGVDIAFVADVTFSGDDGHDGQLLGYRDDEWLVAPGGFEPLVQHRLLVPTR